MSTVIVPPVGSTNPTTVEIDDRHGNHGSDREDHRETRQEASSLTRDIGNVATQAALIEGRAIVEAAKNAAAGILESAKDAAATQILIQTKADAGILEASRHAAAGILEDAKNTASTQVLIQTKADALTLQLCNGFSTIAAQIAECCCSTKLEIRNDGDRTRQTISALTDRINHIEDQRNAVALVDAKMELAALKASCACDGHNGHNSH